MHDEWSLKNGLLIVPPKKKRNENALPFCKKCYVKRDIHTTRKCDNVEMVLKLGDMITEKVKYQGQELKSILKF